MDSFWSSPNFALALETLFYKQQWRQSFLSCKKDRSSFTHSMYRDICFAEIKLFSLTLLLCALTIQPALEKCICKS